MSTPGFRGARLREAREARELSASALAGLLNVSRQLISEFEHDKPPSHDMLGRIAALLRFPRHYFTMTTPSEPDSIVFYRSLQSTTKASRLKAETHLVWAKRIMDVLKDHVTLPPVNLPGLEVPENPAALSKRQIEVFATEVRRFWGLGDGPIGNVVWLLENNGVVVLRREFGDECLDAYSQWRLPEERPFVVLSTDKESAARSRLDACHELAHLLLHRRVPRSVHQQPAMFKLLETQAHQFASAFLLPANSFADECYMVTLDMLRTLKAKWRVAISAMVHRAADLDMIGRDEERRLYINLTRRGWRTSEPLDNELQPEQPRLVRRALTAVLDNKLISQEDLELCVGIYRTDIEVALGLNPGELGGEHAPFRLPLVTPVAGELGLFNDKDCQPLPFTLKRQA